MKVVKDMYRATKGSFLLWIIGGIIIGIGIYINSSVVTTIGYLLILLGIITAIKDYQLDRQIETWLKNNEGKLIFFYATKKEIQDRIKSEVIPLFETNILQAYYDGPKIVGDLAEINHLLRRIMSFNHKIKPHNPSIIKIENGKFVVKDELKLLINIDIKGQIDKQQLQIRLKKVCA